MLHVHTKTNFTKTDLKIFPFKQSSVRFPVMLIGETPQQNNIDVWVAEVQRHDVIVTVGPLVLVCRRHVEFGDTETCAGRAYDVKTLLNKNSTLSDAAIISDR